MRKIILIILMFLISKHCLLAQKNKSYSDFQKFSNTLPSENKTYDCICAKAKGQVMSVALIDALINPDYALENSSGKLML